MTLEFLKVEKRLTLGASSAKPVRVRASINE